MLIEIRGHTPQQPPGPATWFAGAYRPFFLAAGVYALAPLGWWVAAYLGVVATPQGWVPMFWHAHEMLFGFVAAAVAGFLLTAVPKWTDSEPAHGWRLGIAFAAWLVGRLAMAAAGSLSPWVVALIDLLFLPCVGLLVVPPILRRGGTRNLAFVLLLALLLAANALTHAAALEIIIVSPRMGIELAIYTIVVLLVILSGRLVPSFASSALAREGSAVVVRSIPHFEPVVAACVMVAGGSAVVNAPGWFTGTSSLLAGVILLARGWRWRLGACLDAPLLWILHIGHLWLVVGFACVGLSELCGVIPPAAGIHAFTAGAMGTMILGVMTRAALGHSGRELRVSTPISCAYLLVVAGGLARTFLPLFPLDPRVTTTAAASAWAAGFAIFCAVYWPVLTRPRVDGRPG